MLDKIWRFLKQLIQRLFGTNPKIEPTPPQPAPTLTDAEYEAMLMELLEGVNQGWGRGDVAEFLIAKQIKNGDLAAWLRGFGVRSLEGAQGSTASADAVVSLQELARRLELLGGVAGGELGEVAGNVGREILVEFPLVSGEGGEDVDGEAEAWCDRGIIFCDNLQEYEKALASFNKALEFKPDFHRAWHNRGITLYYLDRLEEAITSYDKALEFKPYFHEAWYNRAVALSNLRRFEDAIASFDKALEFKPDNDEAWFYRGFALDNLVRHEDAIASFDKVLEFKPDNDEAWFYRGIELRNLGRHEDAITSYDKALEFKPDNDEVWNNRGAIFCDNLKRYEEAIASFDKALEIKPDFHNAWYNRGIALGNLGRHEDAIASFDKALESKPDYHEAWNNRGAILCDNLKRYEEAIASFDKALKIKPDDHEAWYNRGIALGNLGRHEDVIASFDKALESKPDYHEAWFYRGFALYNLGRLEGAIASYDKALEFKPDYHEAWYHRGNALYNLGRLEEAIASYDKVLEFKPDEHVAWYNRGTVLHNLERWIEAIASYDKALEFKPDYDAALKNRRLALKKSGVVEGVVYYHDKDYQKTVLDFKKQLDNCQPNIHPEEWGKLHQAIGNAHYRRGRWNSHTFYWTKAVNNYEQALITFTTYTFPELYLNVLQDAIKSLIGLEETKKANKLRRDGTNLLHRLLTDKNYSQLSEEQLADKLVRFQQLTVNILIQSGKLTEALATAETDKNVCLSWLLDALPIPDYETEETVTHAQIQQLLNPKTCAIYWHLSDASLTTFIIKSDGLLSPETCFSDFPDEFEKWVKEWNQQYTDYQSKEKTSQVNHPWRGGMASKFAQLNAILKINVIEQQLEGITELILIPHRDLHRFPIHALFSRDFVVSYLPSAAVGINLQHRFSGISRLSPSLDPPKSPLRRGTLNAGDLAILSIENPRSVITDKNGQEQKIDSLPAAHIESQVICRMFDKSTRLKEDAATLDKKEYAVTLKEVEKLLPQSHNIFHFTGHGSYNFDRPLESNLYLSNTDRLTVKEIIQLDLSKYELICLSACETALTDKQTILAEYVGLTSGFMRAGVGSVVSTLWPVESNASALLMIYFYQRWREAGDSLPVALANAQKWLREATREDLAAWSEGEIDKISVNNRQLSEDEVGQRRFFKSIRQELATMELDRPYQHPYYWAAFTITGL